MSLEIFNPTNFENFSLKIVNDYFKDLLKSDDDTRTVGISTSFLGSGSSGGGNRIKFDVRHKLWNDITDTPKEYTNFWPLSCQ